MKNLVLATFIILLFVVGKFTYPWKAFLDFDSILMMSLLGGIFIVTLISKRQVPSSLTLQQIAEAVFRKRLEGDPLCMIIIQGKKEGEDLALIRKSLSREEKLSPVCPGTLNDLLHKDFSVLEGVPRYGAIIIRGDFIVGTSSRDFWLFGNRRNRFTYDTGGVVIYTDSKGEVYLCSEGNCTSQEDKGMLLNSLSEDLRFEEDLENEAA